MPKNAPDRSPLCFALAALLVASATTGAFAQAPASPASAGKAQGQLSLAGKTVPLKVANAIALTDHEGKPYTLVLLTEAPIDLASVVASPDPLTTLLNFAPVNAVTHAKVFVDDERVYINAHSAGDSGQYLATRKFGLEAKVSGGGTKPLEGSLRSTDPEESVQIEVTFKADIIKPGS